jgi:hypothetical protein
MNKLWKRSAAVVACASALIVPGAAQAHWPVPQVNVEVFDRTEGRTLPIYEHEGRRYVVGRPGNEYAIRVRNGAGERVLAVMSVDGVNVITGDTASPDQSGYVLAPHATFDIAGWRKSLARTAAFYFTALPDSYAARTGRPDNVGVIGVAVFVERQRIKPLPGGFLNRERSETDRADAAPASPADAAPASPANAAKQAAAPQLGTGHGRSEDSYAQYTDFERASDRPAQTIAIYYDSYENLAALGVPVGRSPLARVRPDPFPDRGRFAPDPR